MREEIFGDELDVTEKAPEPFESDKSQVKQYRDWLHERSERQLEILQKMKELRPPKIKEVADDGSQNLPQLTDTRKRFREPTVCPEASAVKKNQQRRGLKSPKKKRSGWKFRPGKTSKKIRRRNLPERRKNLTVRTQKRCSLNW